MPAVDTLLTSLVEDSRNDEVRGAWTPARLASASYGALRERAGSLPRRIREE